MKAGAITELLRRHCAGDKQAWNEIFPLVYEQMRKLAGNQLKRERGNHTLQVTGLVNEAFLRLTEVEGMVFRDRAHFLSMAAVCMRRVLVDYARSKNAAKRGGDQIRVVYDERLAVDPSNLPDVLALDAAMQELAKRNERWAKVVELRFFGGMTAEEIAEVLGCSVETVRKDWPKAKAVLYHALKER